MIKIVRKVLGDKITNQLGLIKFRYFPSKHETEGIQKRKAFYGTFVRKGDLVYDVGANRGNRIEPLLQLGANVVAVEPQKSCYDFLKQRYGNKITLITKGLGSEEGVKKFYISNASIISSFSEEWINAVKVKRFKKYHWNAPIDVEMTTLDRLIGEHGTPIFIKIDVEGYELEVLKGLHTPIKMISFEYTTPEQTERAVECITQIESVNSNIECNYSKGEGMELALPVWISAGEMRAGILAKELARGFGDIYVRSK